MLAPPDIAAIIAKLAANVRDRYYKQQTVYLDGYTFTNCCFHNCILITETGTFSLKSCTIVSCSVRYGPNAVRVIRLWNTFTVNTQWPIFNPKIEPDGAVTIE